METVRISITVNNTYFFLRNDHSCIAIHGFKEIQSYHLHTLIFFLNCIFWLQMLHMWTNSSSYCNTAHNYINAETTEIAKEMMQKVWYQMKRQNAQEKHGCEDMMQDLYRKGYGYETPLR